jgi:DNA processing protein
MRHSELFYLLALMKVEGIGDINAKKLLAQFGSAERIFTSKASELPGISRAIFSRLKDKSVYERAEQELAFIEKNHVEVLYFMDNNYPDRLKHCIDGPLLLFASGKMDFSNRRIISVVGTRQITAYGTDVCKNLIADVAPLNPVIVSGLAYGVDIVAHQAAVEHGLQTIGVVAHGLNQVYPKSHKKMVSRMKENGGMLTEFWSTSNPDKENFVRRNRIVAGIAEATVVIESAEKGGSLITAGLANDYNRDVFAVPGRITDRYSIGCNDLIKTQKAGVLTSAADLVYILNWDIPENHTNKSIQKQLFVALEEDEQKIYDYLLGSGKQLLDIIALECSMPVFRLAPLLLNMELKGVVRPLPGKLFEAV